MIPYLTEDNFATETASGTVLVQFTGPGCAACKAQLAHLEVLAAEGVVVFRVDIAKSPAIGLQHQVLTLPTLVVFRGGRPVARHTGIAGGLSRLRGLL